MDWIMDFVTQGKALHAFPIAAVLMGAGLAFGVMMEQRWGWILAGLSMAYIALRLYSYTM